MAGQSDPGGDLLVDDTVDCLGAHVGAHGEHTLEAPCDGLLVAGREQVREILQRNAQRTHIRHFSVDRKSTRLNSSHVKISYAVFCLKKKKKKTERCISRRRRV